MLRRLLRRQPEAPVRIVQDANRCREGTGRSRLGGTGTNGDKGRRTAPPPPHGNRVCLSRTVGTDRRPGDGTRSVRRMRRCRRPAVPAIAAAETRSNFCRWVALPGVPGVVGGGLCAGLLPTRSRTPGHLGPGVGSRLDRHECRSRVGTLHAHIPDAIFYRAMEGGAGLCGLSTASGRRTARSTILAQSGQSGTRPATQRVPSMVCGHRRTARQRTEEGRRHLRSQGGRNRATQGDRTDPGKRQVPRPTDANRRATRRPTGAGRYGLSAPAGTARVAVCVRHRQIEGRACHTPRSDRRGAPTGTEYDDRRLEFRFCTGSGHRRPAERPP